MASLPGDMEQETSQFESKLLGELEYSVCVECGTYRQKTTGKQLDAFCSVNTTWSKGLQW